MRPNQLPNTAGGDSKQAKVSDQGHLSVGLCLLPTRKQEAAPSNKEESKNQSVPVMFSQLRPKRGAECSGCQLCTRQAAGELKESGGPSQGVLEPVALSGGSVLTHVPMGLQGGKYFSSISGLHTISNG